MRWFYRLAALVVVLGGSAFSIQAQSRERLSGWCEKGGEVVVIDGRQSTTKSQRSYPSCSVTIYDAGTTNLSSIASDYSGTPKANPFTASTTGYWDFFGLDGRYDVVLSGGGLTSPVTLSGLWIRNAGGGGGGSGITGSGTTNRIPKFTGSTSVGDSILNQTGTSAIGFTATGKRLSLDSGSQITIDVSNDTTTGTTNDRLAKLSGSPSKAVLAGTSDTTGIVGLVVANGGTSGTATIAIEGIANCEFDAGTAAGQYVLVSTTTGGKCTATSTWPMAKQVIGRVLSTNGAAGTYAVLLFGQERRGFITVGGATTNVLWNNAGAIAGDSGFTYDTTLGLATLGVSSGVTGQLQFKNISNSFTTTLQPGVTASNLTLTLPATLPASGMECLQISSTGALSRTGASCGAGSSTNIRQALNVKLDYGAVGNGIANDTTAIQNAITAALASGSKLVYIPGGTYLVTGLTIPGEVIVQGDGDKKTIITSTTNAVIVTVTGSGAPDFRGPTIEDLKIQGSVSAGTGQIGLKVDDGVYVHSVRVRNVTVADTGGNGLYVGNAYSSTFENMFITNTNAYPLLYNAANMPTNRFESIYIGDLRNVAGALTGFRIKAGDFVCYSCNGVNSGPATSRWLSAGKKNGVDGDVVDSAASVDLWNCNLESWDAYGIYAYSGSVINVRGRSTFAGNGTAGQIGIYLDLTGNGSTYFSEFAREGVIEDSVDFSDGVAVYANSQPIQSNGYPNLVVQGVGPSTGGGNQLTTYQDTSGTPTSRKLGRLDGKVSVQTVTATTSISRPGVKYIAVNHTAPATITIPWAGWYNRSQETLTIQDVSAAGANTNNITIQPATGTINGASTYTLNKAKQTIVLLPDGDTGAGNWRIVSISTATQPVVASGSGGDFLACWDSTGTFLTTCPAYRLSSSIVLNGGLLQNTDNASDWGASGANRPRTVYVGTDVRSPKFTLTGNINWTQGAGSPEGVVTADVGALYSRNNGGTSTTLYVKESGSGNTGWTAHGGGGGGTPGGSSGQVQYNNAGTFAGSSGITLTATQATLVIPVIADFTSANHSHTNVSSGGTLSGGAIQSGTVGRGFLPSLVGDSGAGGLSGLVPAPGAGDAAAGKFLKADGNWVVPSGGGGTPGGSGSEIQYRGGASTFSAVTSSSVSGGQITLADKATVALDNASTSSVDTLFDFQHSSSGTPAAGFGGGLRFALESTTTTNQDAAQLNVSWTTATDASRTALISFSVVGNASVAEVLRLQGAAASAVNYTQIINAATGSSPTISVGGSDSNISLGLSPKGTGLAVVSTGVVVQGGSQAASDAAFLMPFVGGTNSSGPGIRWGSSASYATQSSLFLSNGFTFQGANSTHDPVKIRAGTGTSSDGTLVYEFRPSDGVFNLTPSTGNTTTRHEAQVYDLTSTGTPGNGFGGQITYKGESSTTNSQQMGSFNWAWTDATHASRTSKVFYQTIFNAGSLTETWGVQGAQTYGAAEFDNGNVSGSVTIDLNKGNQQKMRLIGNITTLTINNVKAGGIYRLTFTQDGTGSRTTVTPSNVKNAGGAIGLTALANASDDLFCTSDGTNLRCVIFSDVK